MAREADGKWTTPWARDQARRRPDGIALICESGPPVSWAELANGAEAVARRLRAAGLESGSRLALLLGASRRFVEVLHGAQWVGAAVVPLNDRLAADELRAQIENADPAWLLYDGEHADTARMLGCHLEGMRVVQAGEELEALPAARDPLPERLALSAVHSIIYTSGATGAPKGVMLTNGNHLASARASVERLGLASGDRWLAGLPLCHVGGLSILLRAAIHGISVVLQPRFDAGAANVAIATGGVSIVSLVATMLARLLDAADGTPYPPGFRGVLLGGGPAPRALLERAERAGVAVLGTYGLTETASQVCTATAEDAARAPGSAGRPLNGVALRIEDPDAEGCGEILIGGPQVSPGYFRNVEATERALRGGRLHTGDIGRMDTEGRLWVRGRRDDLIITGGEKVVPEEVEAALAAHPDVVEAAVFGVEDGSWGSRVAAAVVLRPGAGLDPEALRSWCRRFVAGFKVPRVIHAVDALPRTASGKLQRHRLSNISR